MNSLKKAIFALLTLSAGLVMTGCTTKTARDTSIPWSRPATWEGNVPGMGDLGSGDTRR